ncbi:hypothetical protein AB4059_00515 [Lysobacter sp. 2RAF19]
MVSDWKACLAASMIVASTLAGCAAERFRVSPGKVGVEVESPDVSCGERHREIPVKVHVHNDSAGILQIWIDDPVGPPYELSWLSYQVLNEAGKADWRHGPGGHGPMPPPTLKIGPGDRTELWAVLFDVGEADYGRSFRIRFEDAEKHTWTTDAFRPCVQRG